MSFANAPVTRTLVFGLISGSIAASLFDVKHYLYILVDLHFWRYRQFWRMLGFQLCYTNSSEVLFASITFYHMRVLEQMWGSRKYLSFIIVCSILTATITPTLLALFLRPLTAGLFNYLPAGPTPLLFAMLAQYHATIPPMYSYRVATSAAPVTNEPFSGLTFSDKSYRYAIALHLATFQWPGSLLGALVGWVVGYAWRNDLLPGVVTRWRVPGWAVGVKNRRRSEFEGLRRRLEGEGAISMGAASGSQAVAGEATGRQRSVPEDMRDQLRGLL